MAEYVIFTDSTTDLTPERYFEILDRIVDEADRAYQKLAG